MKRVVTFITGANLIAVLVVINMILSFYPFLRIDLTKNKLHSLSSTTINTLKKLDDVINVKVYVTQDLPAEVKPIATSLKTILDEMSRVNSSKFRISYEDPNKSESAKTEAEKYGIQALQFSNIKSDKFEVQSGYFGLAMIFGKKQVVLPVANDVGNMEYFVVSGLKKLINDKTPTVALTDNTIVGNNSGSVQYLRKFLERNYIIVDATLNGEAKLPEEADSLVVVGQNSKIDDKGLAKISQWVKSGKGLIGYISPISVGQEMKAMKNDPSGLENIFKEYGMEMEPKLIWDTSATLANFQSQSGTFLTKYQYWPQIISSNIYNALPINSGINSLMAPWPAPIKISGGAKAIFTSSKESMIDDSYTDLSPVKSQAPGGERDQHVIGAINTEKVKVALISSPLMIQDQFVANNQQNLLLGLNLVDYFSQDSSLLSIRGKNLEINTLMPVSDQVKSYVKAVNLTVPGIFLLACAVIFGIFRKKNNDSWRNFDDAKV